MRNAIQQVDRTLADMQATDQEIVLDGAVDADRYLNANPRLLWILREPNGKGPWDLREYFRESLFTYDRWQRTAGLMVRVSHGLFHGRIPWGAWASDARAIADSLRDVAVININKRGGDANVDWDRLYRSSLDFGSVICQQVDALNAQIVILAGTLDVLPNQLRQRLRSFDESDVQAVRIGGAVYVRAYHTNQRTITHEEYYARVCKSLDGIAP